MKNGNERCRDDKIAIVIEDGNNDERRAVGSRI